MDNILKFSHLGFSSRYLHVVQNNRPTLIFLMGSLQEIESVQVFNSAFSRDYNYYAIELPGSGNTDPLHPKYDVSFLAEYLSVMIRQLGLNQVSLVACSYATGIALEFAKKNRDKLHRMVLAGSMREIPLSEWPTMLQLMRDCAFDTPNFANGFIDLLTEKQGLVPRQETIRKAAVRKASKYRSSNFWHFVFNTIRLMCYEPSDLQQVSTPTMVFTGEFDPYVKPEHAERLAKEMSNAQFELIRGCDHLFHIQQPEQTIGLILNFLADEAKHIAA